MSALCLPSSWGCLGTPGSGEEGLLFFPQQSEGFGAFYHPISGGRD